MSGARQVLARHGRSFWLASLLLPPSVRSDITILYAFFRTLDDLVDERTLSVSETRSSLLTWRTWISTGFRSSPPDPELGQAVEHVFRRYRLCPVYTIELIDSLLGDLHPRRTGTRDELLRYCYGVGGTVGLTLAPLLGVHCSIGREAACTLGIAMQLTNIARDLGEDLRRDHLYFPREDLQRLGICESALFTLAKDYSQPPPEVRRLVQLQASRAQQFYQRAREGYVCLPHRVRLGIIAAAELYGTILTALERNGYDSIRRRAIASPDDKLFAIFRAWQLTHRYRRREETPCPTCG
ncbi:MAG: phytoene/squalene synthase family protein [Thermomicrobium sp.]